jgi:hypothetical protein
MRKSARNFSVQLRMVVVLLVGVNYDEKSKKHSCIIEKYVRE